MYASSPRKRGPRVSDGRSSWAPAFAGATTIGNGLAGWKAGHEDHPRLAQDPYRPFGLARRDGGGAGNARAGGRRHRGPRIASAATISSSEAERSIWVLSQPR